MKYWRKKIMKNNLYVNVEELLELMECIKKSNPQCAEVVKEIMIVIHDLKWRKIEDEKRV